MKTATGKLCEVGACAFSGGYQYSYYHRIGRISEYGSATNAMRKLQTDPGSIFPFGIEGCAKFVTGAECRLVNALDLPGRTQDIITSTSGYVDVTVSPTSTLFTVSREGYFDSVGSTIEFVTVESGGDLYLGQIGDAEETFWVASIGVMYGGAEATWQEQADNLRRNLP